MIGQRIVLKRGGLDDAEKPFWISFADLMTALMVLFLVVLSAALVDAKNDKEKAEHAKNEAEVARAAAERAKHSLEIAQRELKRQKEELERREKARDTRRERYTAEINAFLDDVEQIVSKHDGVKLDRERHVINFGSRAQFESGKHFLTSQQARTLKRFVPDFLDLARLKGLGQDRWLKRLVVEGFTDDTWNYLGNLNLSLQRSQRVLCVLLAGATGKTKIIPVASDDQMLIRKLFMVGGFSSNSQRKNREASRRVELRIEFYQLDEKRQLSPASLGGVGTCQLPLE